MIFVSYQIKFRSADYIDGKFVSGFLTEQNSKPEQICLRSFFTVIFIVGLEKYFCQLTQAPKRFNN